MLIIDVLPPFPPLANVLFVIIVAVVVLAIALGVNENARRLGFPNSGRERLVLDISLLLLVWLALTGFLAWRGLLLDFESTPPRVFLVIAPAFVLVVVALAARAMREFQLAVPVAWLVALQTFRLPLEMVLYLLAEAGVTPRIMTFEGRNFDILIGITAPLVAFALFSAKPWAYKLAAWWNVLGLLLLINVAGTGILSTPTRFQVFDVQPANTFIAHFPYVWLVSFLVPLALYLHLSALRNLGARRNNSGR